MADAFNRVMSILAEQRAQFQQTLGIYQMMEEKKRYEADQADKAKQRAIQAAQVIAQYHDYATKDPANYQKIQDAVEGALSLADIKYHEDLNPTFEAATGMYLNYRKIVDDGQGHKTLVSLNPDDWNQIVQEVSAKSQGGKYDPNLYREALKAKGYDYYSGVGQEETNRTISNVNLALAGGSAKTGEQLQAAGARLGTAKERAGAYTALGQYTTFQEAYTDVLGKVGDLDKAIFGLSRLNAIGQQTSPSMAKQILSQVLDGLVGAWDKQMKLASGGWQELPDESLDKKKYSDIRLREDIYNQALRTGKQVAGILEKLQSSPEMVQTEFMQYTKEAVDILSDYIASTRAEVLGKLDIIGRSEPLQEFPDEVKRLQNAILRSKYIQGDGELMNAVNGISIKTVTTALPPGPKLELSDIGMGADAYTSSIGMAGSEKYKAINEALGRKLTLDELQDIVATPAAKAREKFSKIYKGSALEYIIDLNALYRAGDGKKDDASKTPTSLWQDGFFGSKQGVIDFYRNSMIGATPVLTQKNGSKP